MARLIECPDVQTVITNPNGKIIHLPAGDFIVSESIVLDGQYLRGANMQTRLYPEPGVTAITIKSPPSTERRWDTAFNPTTKMFAGCEGIVIAGTFEGQRGIITEGQCDQVHMQDIKVANCDGGGIHFNPVTGFIRESHFSNLSCDKCGSGTTPALGIYQPDTGSGDGTNNLYFYNTRLVYSYGTALLIRNSDADERIREIKFESGLFHMMDADGPGPWSLVILDNAIGQIDGISFRMRFRGDDAEVVPTIVPGTAINCFYSGTHFPYTSAVVGVTVLPG